MPGLDSGKGLILITHAENLPEVFLFIALDFGNAG